MGIQLVLWFYLLYNLQKGASSHNGQAERQKTRLLPLQSTVTISALCEACEPGVLLQLPLRCNWVMWCWIWQYTWEISNTAPVVTMIWVSYWLVMSRDSHMSGADPMRAETLIQEQRSHPVFITPESKEFKLGCFKKKKQLKKNKQNNFTTICKHERRQNMADRKL